MSLTDNDVAEVRHVVQRILVPGVFVIGLLGNSLSIYVLTRRRMRCTTNIYLTALAITDIIYLTMALLLSLQHYQYVHLYFKVYWTCYGAVVWLCDACSYISIYIAVCFTIERFIAIRYPLKRRTFCTESLAKKVIAGVTLFCLLSTISTAFEHQQSTEYRMIDNLGRPCNQTLVKVYAIQQQQQPQQKHESTLDVMEKFVDFLYNETKGRGAHNDRNFILPEETQVLTKLSASNQNTEKALGAATRKIKSRNDLRQSQIFVRGGENAFDVKTLAQTKLPPISLIEQMDSNNRENYSDTDLVIDAIHVNTTDYCENVTYYNHKPTALGDDNFYINVWYFVTLCVFVLIPLCVLVTFNCFLIMLVRRSNTTRVKMTNASSIRRQERKSNTSSVSQENRVTITLIAVVLLFIVCQLPWAVYLIVSCQVEIESHLQSVFGNIFNFLAATNAAANFFLYCVLSDKYRNTIREMITGYRYKQQRNTLTTTSLFRNGSRRIYRPAYSASLVIK